MQTCDKQSFLINSKCRKTWEKCDCRLRSLLLLFITRRHAQARSVESALPTLPKFPRKSTALGADIGHFKILAVGEVLRGMLEIDQHFVMPRTMLSHRPWKSVSRLQPHWLKSLRPFQFCFKINEIILEYESTFENISLRVSFLEQTDKSEAESEMLDKDSSISWRGTNVRICPHTPHTG